MIVAGLLVVLVVLVGSIALVLRHRDEGQPGGGPAQARVSSPAGVAPTPPEPAIRRDASGRRLFTVLGAGDILIHPELTSQARRDAERAGHPGELDFNPLFDQVRATVSAADLAICHLETPVAPANGPFVGFPRFSVPPQIVDAIRETGFDACSTASNHTLDQGERGIKRTLDALDAAKIRHTGSARTAREALTPSIYVKNGVKVGHLAYALHFNGLKRPAGRDWVANLIEPREILAAAKRLRTAGAEIVVLSLHWGTEYMNQPDAGQEKWVKPLISSPNIDLILGHHAHVVQPVRRFGGDWVAFGHGNQVARHAEPIFANREGVLTRFTFTEVAPGRWRVTLAQAIPIWMDLNPDARLVDLPVALAEPATAKGRKIIYRAALDRIRGHLLAGGGAEAGLKVLGPAPANDNVAIVPESKSVDSVDG
ncbi:CapA family protein [Micromonospora sp. WMMD980]|uniref:CapA family protein n=1 Tax=Micromonospora sp. WMMD980 TaxID=3016088 RepID=UPI00241783BE|nr:CapA family protein [Micromonospora sp. WMMD980]MDG4803415.1 CapA family protein [Micromonospora sp. WMMD980]